MTDMEMAADLGLRIEHEPYSNGIKARAVYRGQDRIYHDDATGARHFLKGYAAAGAHGLRAADRGAGRPGGPRLHRG